MAVEKRGRGRPRKAVPSRAIQVFLPEDLRQDLQILCTLMDGEPSLSGVVRSAIKSYIDDKMKSEPIRRALRGDPRERVHLVQDGGTR